VVSAVQKLVAKTTTSQLKHKKLALNPLNRR